LTVRAKKAATATAFRLPIELVRRIDRHAEKLERAMGLTVTRSNVVRMLLIYALNDLENQK